MPGLRSAPVRVVKESGASLRMIHDLTMELGNGGLVNLLSEPDEIPKGEMVKVLKEVLTRFFGGLRFQRYQLNRKRIILVKRFSNVIRSVKTFLSWP